VNGYKAIYDNNVMHRDLKLENLLIHFPDRPELEKMKK